ncbi:pimeloyl-ACP methyl ester carboxylesterase [Natranaerovirga hydrolytica]|uniref:Pimeloyl-ACP methyl ester carboxylesterase n=1 Tax=Natranaerovirga hydrolytica TaxID=680378 RepID=A0A4R1MC42_9FIRM|nr:alpha/beta hydrolase [Natranaerovirga hydrolytica]TCK89142.1 pimeloyl-ACP methyl ester carboxylesterase [Natranaerovirga hydrolytica]
MNVLTFGEKKNPAIVLIHGYGITWKMWEKQINAFKGHYFVVVPLLDGMDLDTSSEFYSVQASANDIINYTKTHLSGSIYAVIGSSLGGSITIDILSKKQLKINKAIIDAGVAAPINKYFLKLAIKMRKWQNKKIASESKCVLNMVKKNMPEELVEEMVRLSKVLTEKTIHNVHQSVFTYQLPSSISETTTEVAYWYGSKEMIHCKKTIENLKQYLPKIVVKEFKGYNHGELVMKDAHVFIEQALLFLTH